MPFLPVFLKISPKMLHTRPFNLHSEKWFVGCHLIFLYGATWDFFRVASMKIFFQGGHLIFFRFTSIKPHFLKMPPWKNLGRSYPKTISCGSLKKSYVTTSKSIYRVQIKWANSQIVNIIFITFLILSIESLLVNRWYHYLYSFFQ